MKRILIAGIGNIFHGDDGFGCEVANELREAKLPQEVMVTDFGIRSYDLAYALTDGYDAVILLDAVPRGESPGTVYLIEPDPENLESLEPAAVDAHSMNPVSVLQMARSMGGIRGKLFLVGCEPEGLGEDGGEIGLSKAVRGAIPRAINMTCSVVAELLAGNQWKSESVAN